MSNDVNTDLAGFNFFFFLKKLISDMFVTFVKTITLYYRIWSGDILE